MSPFSTLFVVSVALLCTSASAGKKADAIVLKEIAKFINEVRPCQHLPPKVKLGRGVSFSKTFNISKFPEAQNIQVDITLKEVDGLNNTVLSPQYAHVVTNETYATIDVGMHEMAMEGLNFSGSASIGFTFEGEYINFGADVSLAPFGVDLDTKATFGVGVDAAGRMEAPSAKLNAMKLGEMIVDKQAVGFVPNLAGLHISQKMERFISELVDTAVAAFIMDNNAKVKAEIGAEGLAMVNKDLTKYAPMTYKVLFALVQEWVQEENSNP